ncbi:tyrosine-type recombinase/integrase [Saccharospirillum alexandrii]|uniref:tyrosine-type recombinase/integrase n=1 Tax=Saccharospirillum alexandrii TaxID=2448477 RepID=UPI003735E0FC
MALTDKQIKGFQPAEKDQWVSDEHGLRLLIKPNGAKYWRLKYRFAGKQKTLAIGVYPKVTLKQARLQVLDAKQKIATGIDPSQERIQVKLGIGQANENTLERVALEWWNHQKGTWTEHHADRVWKRLDDNILSKIGGLPIAEVNPDQIIANIRKVEERNALDVSERVLQDVRRVCRYAVQVGILKVNPASELSGVLKARKRSHRPSMPLKEMPKFLNELEDYTKHGRLLTKLALELLVLTFVRPGELRGAEWEEFDLEQRLWRIPGKRMKMGTDHIVPLSNQALAVIEQVEPISGQYRLLFPSERERSRAMSENTLGKALRVLGYDGTVQGKSKTTPHGFRATASSALNETGFNPDAIERQLSHMERNGVRAAYTHHAQYLDERKDMMQKWADYMDLLKAKKKLVPFNINNNH